MNNTGRIVARNSLFSLAGQLALKLLSFAFTVAVVRQLGDVRYGQYSTIIAFVGILAVFADLGMANYAVREIARDHRRTAALFANMIVLRLILSLVVLIANVILAVALGYTPETVSFIALSSVGLLFYAFQGPLSVILQGFERINYTSTYNVINQIIFIVVGAFLLWNGWGVPGVIIASFCGVIAISIMSWRTVRNLANLTFEITPATWPSLLKAGLPFGVITFATMLSFKVDTVLLSLWRPAEEVGWYNVAYNLIFALLLLSSSFNSTLVPSLSRQHSVDPAGVGQFYLRAVRLLWSVSLPVAVGATLLGNRLIILIYGDEYAPAGLALQILIWVLPALTLTSLCGAITTVYHREKATARINLINAAFNIALNIWAIPRYGLLGAAIMTVATEVLGLVQYTLLLRDTFPLRTIASAFRAPLLAVLVMAGTILLAWQLPVVAIIFVGAGVYGVILVLTGGLKTSELKVITSTITSVFTRRTATAK